MDQTMKVWIARLVLAGALVTGVLMSTPHAHAAVLCEPRSEKHQMEHGGFEADNAFHISHGDLPTCKPDNDEASAPADHHDNDKDDKSRYCKRKWFC